MNNKIIALAVAGALTAPMMAVEAAPTVYGFGQVEFAQTSNSSSTVSDKDIVTDNKRGRFGIKGSEDLGGGLKSIYQLEFGIDTTGSKNSGSGGAGNTIFNREMMIGLKIGKSHTIQMGNLKSAYKYMGGVKYDSFVATTLQARESSTNVTGSGGAMSGGSLGHGGFLNNSIAYIGKFKPVKVWLTTNLDNTAGDTAITTLGVSAKLSSFEFGAVTLSKDNCTAGSTNCAGGVGGQDSTKLFGSWSKGQHTVRAQIENVQTTNAAGTDTGETDYTYLNYQFKMGKHLVDVAIGEKDQNVLAGDNDEDWTRLAYAYNFSKKTMVFAGVAENDANGTSNDWDTFSIGMRVKF